MLPFWCWHSNAFISAVINCSANPPNQSLTNLFYAISASDTTPTPRATANEWSQQFIALTNKTAAAIAAFTNLPLTFHPSILSPLGTKTNRAENKCTLNLHQLQILVGFSQLVSRKTIWTGHFICQRQIFQRFSAFCVGHSTGPGPIKFQSIKFASKGDHWPLGVSIIKSSKIYPSGAACNTHSPVSQLKSPCLH